MRKPQVILYVSIALLAFAAIGCRNENNANTSTTATGTQAYGTPSSTDTTSTTSSAPETNTASSTATTGSAAETTSPFGNTPFSDPDHKGADKFAEGNADEIEMSKMASTKTTDPDVKNFAQRMVTDHTNALDELQQIAKAKNVTCRLRSTRSTATSRRSSTN